MTAQNSHQDQQKHYFDDKHIAQYQPQAHLVKGRYTLTRMGLVWPSFFLSKKTTYANLSAKFLTYFYSILSVIKRGSSPYSKERIPALIHSNWSLGYYHWLTESLPRAMVLRENFPEAVPVLPQYFEKYSDSLAAIGISEIEFFPEQKNLTVDKFVITDCPRTFGTTHPSILGKLSKKIGETFALDICVRPHLTVYVSRRRARGRYVKNEREVIEALSPLNPVVVCLEDLSFVEQVLLMHKTKLLIGIHGAGLTNAMFMQKGTSLIELLPKRNGIFDYNRVRNSFKHDACFWNLCKAFSIRHKFLLCNHDLHFWQRTHMSNIFVDTRNLKQIISELSN